MKALSFKPEWAYLIASGYKTIEVRTWQTKAPIDLLICTSKSSSFPFYPKGYAVGVIHVEAIAPMHEDLLEEACMDEMPDKPSYAWHISSFYPCKPFPVKGKLHIYDVPVEFEELETLPDGATVEEMQRLIHSWLAPLVDSIPNEFEEALESEEFRPLIGY